MQFTKSIIASGGHLKASLTLKHTKEVNGITMYKAKKTEYELTRLLGLKFKEWDSGTAARPLSNTNIIETLTQLRDEKFDSWCIAPAAAAEDLGLDDDQPRKVKAVPQVDMPDMCSITTPEFKTVPSIQMTVLLNRGPLWIELNNDNIKYISDVCKMQIMDGDIQSKHRKPKDDDDDDQLTTGVAGINMIRSGRMKGAIRCVYRDGLTKKSKYITAHMEKKTRNQKMTTLNKAASARMSEYQDEQGIDIAIDVAKNFLNGAKRTAILID